MTKQQRNTKTLNDVDIGRRLKSLRQSKGYSLAKLSALSAISEATLSRVENAQVLVSAHNLYVLSNVLDADITAFYSDESSPLRSGIRSISRQDTGHEISTESFLTTVLAGDLAHKKMHPSVNVIERRQPGSDNKLRGHAGEEFLYVLQGKLVLHSEHYAPLLLEVGDSIYFDGSMPHAYFSGGDTPAQFLVITTIEAHSPTGT